MSLGSRMDRLERQLTELPEGSDKVQLLAAMKTLRRKVADVVGVRHVLEEPGDMLSKLRASEHIELYEDEMKSSVSKLGRLIAILPEGELKDRIVETYDLINILIGSGNK